MKRILAATDLSTRADAAVRRAGLLAREHAAELVICHVVEDDQPERMRQLECAEATRELESWAERAPELQGIPWSTTVVFGDAFNGILQATATSAAELIVLGSHRRRLLRDIFIGTTAERVMRHGSVPVLMVNTAPIGPYKRCLAAVDFSDCSARAVTVSRQLGLLDSGHLNILHVYNAMLSVLLSANATEDAIKAHVASMALDARREAEAFLRQVDLTGVRHSIDVQHGDPVQTIQDAIRARSHDLLILGTRGKTGLARVLLGSVANDAIRATEIDVLAVPPAERTN